MLIWMSVYVKLEFWAKVTTEILGVDVLQQRSEVLKYDWGNHWSWKMMLSFMMDDFNTSNIRLG